jgi:hypothetical protein
MTAASARHDPDEDPDDLGNPDEPGRPDPRRPHPYTIEGYLLGMGDFATGAVRATGWRRTMAVAVAWAVLIPVGLGVLVGIGRLMSLLIWH